jgi:hypothetical protein
MDNVQAVEIFKKLRSNLTVKSKAPISSDIHSRHLKLNHIPNWFRFGRATSMHTSKRNSSAPEICII